MPLNPNLGTSHLPKYAKYALQGGGASRELASLLDPLHRACLPPPPAHTCKETPPPPPAHPCREVEKLASLSGIHLRTGCLCNPGACAAALGLTAAGAHRPLQ